MRDAPTVPVTPPSGASGALHAACSRLLGGALVRAAAVGQRTIAYQSDSGISIDASSEQDWKASAHSDQTGA